MMLQHSFRVAAYIAALTVVTACAQNATPISGPLPPAARSSSMHFNSRPRGSATTTYLYTSYDNVTNAVLVLKVNGAKPATLVDTITQGIDFPLNIAIDKSGTLYVANQGLTPEVTEYPAGQNAPSVTLTQGLSFPNGVAVDRFGNVWVSNGQSVLEYGRGKTSPKLTLTNGITGASAVAVDSGGTVYVTNAGGSSPDVLVYPRGATSPKTMFGQGDLREPCGVTLDKLGNIYVGDFTQGQVYVFSARSHKLLRTVSHYPYFSEPCGVTIDPQGRLYQGGGGSGGDVNVLQIPQLGKGTPNVVYEANGLYGVAADPTVEP